MNWFWWAPLLASIAHISEEFVYPGGFADWDRAYRQEIRNSITPRLHVVVNLLLLFACVSVALSGTAGGFADLGFVQIRSFVPPRQAPAGWIALAALLVSNAVFHVAGTIRTKTISPGVRTALLLYVPLAVYGYWHLLSGGLISFGAAILATVLGGSYHLWAAMLHRLRSTARPSSV